MAKLERTYNVPLRRKWLMVPKYKRAKKAVSAIKEFMAKHMKSDNIKLGEHLNKEIWKDGIKNPPHHVKVTAVKEDDGLVKVELFGKEYVVKKREKKVEKTKTEELKEKLMGKAGVKPEQKKEEPKAEKPKEALKTEVKEEPKKTTEKPKETPKKPEPKQS